MANIDDINLFHKLNVEREIIPNKYQLLINYNNCKHYNKPNLKSIGNLPRNHEDQYIFYNYDNNENKNFRFNNFINIDKSKLMTYFLCNNFEELFSLIELYILNLFNGYNTDKISEIFKKGLITDSVFVNAIYCINIIKLNKKSYNKILIKNNSMLKTSEIMIKLKEISLKNPKNEALLLILKFIDLLKAIDEIGFIKEIEKLEDVFDINYIKN